MAAYDSLASGAATDDEQSVVRVATGPAAAKFILSRLGDRAELCEDAERGRACETWRFDEDAYTLGLTALFTSNMSGAVPALLLAFSAPALQMFITLQVFGYLTNSKKLAGECLQARLVCSGLSILQLTNEAVEGLYKVIFSLRWLLGFYDCNICMTSAVFGALLGFMQMLLGIVTCVLCINVIFSSTSILDTFFNYVALAFIADVDNYIINSRIIRAFKAFQNFELEIKVVWKPVEQLKLARAKWFHLVVVTCNMVLMVVVPFSVVGNEMLNSISEQPLELHWWSMAPRCLALWLALIGAVRVAGGVLPICKVALGITILCFLMLVVAFCISMFWLSESPRSCMRTWSPLERCVLWTFSTMLLPSSCAAELRPFSIVKLIPLQVNLVIVSTLLWNYEIVHSGCA